MTAFKPDGYPALSPYLVVADPDPRGGFEDSSGITWWVATQIDAR